MTCSTYAATVSPSRPPRDIEGLNRVLTLLGVLMLGLALAAASYGGWRVLAEVRLAAAGDPVTEAGLFAFLTAVCVALGVGCLRLSRDDGSGTWCEECVARNPHNAPLCEACGAELP